MVGQIVLNAAFDEILKRLEDCLETHNIQEAIEEVHCAVLITNLHCLAIKVICEKSWHRWRTNSHACVYRVE